MEEKSDVSDRESELQEFLQKHEIQVQRKRRRAILALSQPSYESYKLGVVVSTCCKEMDLDKAFETYQIAKQNGIIPSNDTYSNLLSLAAGFGDQGSSSGPPRETEPPSDANAALAVFTDMKIAGIKFNESMYTAMIRCLSNDNRVDEVLGLYQEMGGLKLSPKLRTMLPILSMCARLGLDASGFELFEDLITKHSLEPTEREYLCMLNLTLKLRDSRFYTLLDSMMEDILVPSHDTWEVIEHWFVGEPGYRVQRSCVNESGVVLVTGDQLVSIDLSQETRSKLLDQVEKLATEEVAVVSERSLITGSSDAQVAAAGEEPINTYFSDTKQGIDIDIQGGDSEAVSSHVGDGKEEKRAQLEESTGISDASMHSGEDEPAMLLSPDYDDGGDHMCGRSSEVLAKSVDGVDTSTTASLTKLSTQDSEVVPLLSSSTINVQALAHDDGVSSSSSIPWKRPRGGRGRQGKKRAVGPEQRREHWDRYKQWLYKSMDATPFVLPATQLNGSDDTGSSHERQHGQHQGKEGVKEEIIEQEKEERKEGRNDVVGSSRDLSATRAPRHQFDVIVDGANVGYYKQNYEGAPAHVDYTQIDWMVRHLTQRGFRPLLILHCRHLRRDVVPAEFKPIVDSWDDQRLLYQTPAGCNDDWFWLYAAVRWKCKVVTNDEMRDHHFQMLSPRCFARWKERNQVHFSFGQWEREPTALTPAAPARSTAAVLTSINSVVAPVGIEAQSASDGSKESDVAIDADAAMQRAREKCWDEAVSSDEDDSHSTRLNSPAKRVRVTPRLASGSSGDVKTRKWRRPLLVIPKPFSYRSQRVGEPGADLPKSTRSATTESTVHPSSESESSAHTGGGSSSLLSQHVDSVDVVTVSCPHTQLAGPRYYFPAEGSLEWLCAYRPVER